MRRSAGAVREERLGESKMNRTPGVRSARVGEPVTDQPVSPPYGA